MRPLRGWNRRLTLPPPSLRIRVAARHSGVSIARSIGTSSATCWDWRWTLPRCCRRMNPVTALTT